MAYMFTKGQSGIPDHYRVLDSSGNCWLSSLGVYANDIHIPVSAFYAGLGDQKLITTLCPGGKERMRRLMGVISTKRVGLKPMVTHRFQLSQILEAYDLFSNQRAGVLKVAITP